MSKIFSESRKDPVVFETMLKRSLPMSIILSNLDQGSINSMLQDLSNTLLFHVDRSTWEANFNSMKAAISSEVFLRTIHRGEKWEIQYDSTHARLVLSISHNKVQWQLFANVTKEPLGSPLGKYLRRFPIAQMILSISSGDILDGSWHLWLPDERKFDATLTMTAPMAKCYENFCGLTSFDEKLVNTNIRVDIEQFDLSYFERDIRGDYKLSQQCGQTFNSLHFKLIPQKMNHLCSSFSITVLEKAIPKDILLSLLKTSEDSRSWNTSKRWLTLIRRSDSPLTKLNTAMMLQYTLMAVGPFVGSYL